MTSKDEKADIIKSDNADSTNIESADTKSDKTPDKIPDKTTAKKYGLFSGIINFINSVIGELKQVTTPTKDQLGEYIIVVLVFVLVIMLFITGVDMAIGQLIMWLFAK